MKSDHVPTGRTRDFYGLPDDPNRVELPPPVLLRIVHYDADDCFYLLYCNADGVELTDTFRDSIEDAQRQAQFEFNVRTEEWVRTST